MPLIVTHGWPGSVAEFLEVIGPLSDPRAHGGDPADAFHLVIPSIPGFGFSGRTSEAGWNTGRVARAWAELMRRLGYGHYGAQGGDFGAFVSPELGHLDPDHVVGIHVNAASVGFIPWGDVDPAELASFTDVEKGRLERTRLSRMSRLTCHRSLVAHVLNPDTSFDPVRAYWTHESPGVAAGASM
jgi:pimeloyl-ACP methyl ester carboxylesterase